MSYKRRRLLALGARVGYVVQQDLSPLSSQASNNETNDIGAQLTVDSKCRIKTGSLKKLLQRVQTATVYQRILRHDSVELHTVQRVELTCWTPLRSLHVTQAVAYHLRATSRDRRVERTTHYKCCIWIFYPSACRLSLPELEVFWLSEIDSILRNQHLRESLRSCFQPTAVSLTSFGRSLRAGMC